MSTHMSLPAWPQSSNEVRWATTNKEELHAQRYVLCEPRLARALAVAEVATDKFVQPLHPCRP